MGSRMATRGSENLLVVGHRGNAGQAPENTLVSYREAREAGADLAECDVRLTRDGHLVLLHDATLDRTTDGTGPLADHTLAELGALDAGGWKAPAYAGERIPTLEALLRQHAEDGLPIVVEVKEHAATLPTVRAVHAGGGVRRSVVISFDIEVCRLVRETEQGLPCLLLASNLPSDKRERADFLDKLIRRGVYGLDALASTLDADFVRSAHLRGLSVWCWTVDEAAEWERLLSIGVDAITTNVPGELSRWLGR
jgi:glycerophosphoryl diester phosphodiesterase